MLAGASVRREGYALLAEHAAPPAGGPAPVHRLARGTRHLDIAVATRPLDWPGAVEHTDQVVVATTTGDGAAVPAAFLLAEHRRMAAALADLNRQMAGAAGRVSVVRIQSSKGL